MDRLEEAIAFARKLDIKIEDDGQMITATYPNGESKEFYSDGPETPQRIKDMACNLL